MELQQLVRLAQNDDHDAFGEIVRRFQDMAYAVAYSQLRDPHLAEDAAQDAFIAAYTGLPKLKEPRAFPGWFRTLLHRQCVHRLRAPAEPLLPIDDLLPFVSREPLPFEVAERNEARAFVRDAIDSLPEHERVATALFYTGDHSLKEIAQFLEIPQATVKTRLHSARKRLKEKLMQSFGEELQQQRPSKDERFATRVLHITEALSIRTFARYATYQISPEGDHVACVTQLPGREERHSRGVRSHFLATGAPGSMVGGEITVQHLPTGAVRRLTAEEGSDGSPRWSPDGRFLAFYSDRSGKAQLWVWNRETGEQRAVSDAAIRCHGGWEGPQWTPDGSSLVVRLAPDPSVDPPTDPAPSGSLPNGPRVCVHDPSPREREGDGPPDTKPAPTPLSSGENLRSRFALLRAETGAVTLLTPEVRTYGWSLSPNGETLAFLNLLGAAPGSEGMLLWELSVCALGGGDTIPLIAIPQNSGVSLSWSPDGTRLAYYNSETRDAHVIPAAGGEPVNVTSGSPEKLLPRYTEGIPTWSLDGRSLYLLGSGHLWQAFLDGEVRKLSEGLEESVIGVVHESDRYVACSPDGGDSLILHTTSSAREESVYRLHRETGTVRRLFASASRLRHFKSHGSPSTEGHRLFYIVEDAAHPPDLWESDDEFRAPRQVTHLNPHLEAGLFREPRVVEWTAADGRAMKGALLLPSGYRAGQRLPVILLLDPGLSLDSSLRTFGLWGANRGNLHLLASQGYGILTVELPLQTHDPMKEIPGRVLPALDRLVELGIADGERFGMMGYGNGGYAVNAMITQTHRFNAAVSIAGISDMVSFYLGMDPHMPSARYTSGIESELGGTLWEQRQRYIENSPIFHLDRVSTPLLLLHGEEDPLPPSQSREMFAGLRRLDKPVSLALYPGEGHHILENWLSTNIGDLWARTLGWFDRYLRR